jgi:hypothetical protein
MKKLTIFICFILLSVSAFANNTAYRNAMQKNIEAFKEAKTKESLQEVANAFERIAKRESKEWLPQYYAGLSYIHMSMRLKEAAARDQVLDQGRRFVDAALSLAPLESEVQVLEGYWTMMKLSIDGANRGQELSPLAMQQFGRAIQLGPDNPRAYLMMGQMEWGMAQFFGSSTDRACQLARKGLQLFESQPPSDALLPAWGKETAVQMSANCK